MTLKALHKTLYSSKDTGCKVAKRLKVTYQAIPGA